MSAASPTRPLNQANPHGGQPSGTRSAVHPSPAGAALTQATPNPRSRRNYSNGKLNVTLT